MSDERIPDDIRAAAEKVYDALGRGSTADETTIARAILAERNRVHKQLKGEGSE